MGRVRRPSRSCISIRRVPIWFSRRRRTVSIALFRISQWERKWRRSKEVSFLMFVIKQSSRTTLISSSDCTEYSETELSPQ